MTVETPFPFLNYLRLGEIKRLVHRFNDQVNQHQAKAVSITSLQPGEGRTFLVAVLAIGQALFLKKKVLVIDASSQPEKGHLYLNRIFEDELLGKCVDLISPKNKTASSEDTADFELRELIESYKRKYDLILLDTTAIESSNTTSMDPMIVSKAAEHTLMILSNPSISSGNFKHVKKDFESWGIHLLGTVYNFGSLK